MELQQLVLVVEVAVLTAEEILLVAVRVAVVEEVVDDLLVTEQTMDFLGQ
jgi:hypothetical protein